MERRDPSNVPRPSRRGRLGTPRRGTWQRRRRAALPDVARVVTGRHIPCELHRRARVRESEGGARSRDGRCSASPPRRGAPSSIPTMSILRRAGCGAPSRPVADFEEEFRLLTPLGEVRWVAVRSVPFSVTDERSVGRLGTMEDVSERRAAQEALQRSEELHRSVIESMTEGIYIQAADGHLIESNPAARRLLGTPSGDLRDVAVVREDGTSLPKSQFPAAVALRTGHSSTELVVGVQDPVLGRRWLAASSQPLRRDEARTAVGGGVHLQRRHRPTRDRSHEERVHLGGQPRDAHTAHLDKGCARTRRERGHRRTQRRRTTHDGHRGSQHRPPHPSRERHARPGTDRVGMDRARARRRRLGRLVREAVAIMRPVAEREGIEIVADETGARRQRGQRPHHPNRDQPVVERGEVLPGRQFSRTHRRRARHDRRAAERSRSG